jgi:hypothetical protein
MPKFYYPCLFIAPGFDEDGLSYGSVALRKRRWEVSTFDLATLATKHRLHLRYQLIDILLAHCNLEIELEADNLEEACAEIDVLRAMLYVQGTSPFVIPFCATHSLNEYAGINSRDSEILRAKLPEDLQRGPTSSDIRVEVWPHEPSLTCRIEDESVVLRKEQWDSAAGAVSHWKKLEMETTVLRASRKALCSAPAIPDIGSSLLHVWQGIESLFPSVNMEVSFRLSLLVAQLVSILEKAGETYKKAKRSYADRSRIAHGNAAKVGHAEWNTAWTLLVACLRAVLFG